MTVPKKWVPGDQITADRLNIGNAESLRSRRDINLGQGSSMVYEALGNQSANMRVPLLRLMIAIQDFAIPDGRTDLSVGPDDVPSGFCRDMRLNRNDSTHREESAPYPERVWDALGGLNGAPLRQCGEVFYVVFNQDSKRWEILQSASIRLIPAIVRQCLSGGWHEVEITDWDERPDAYIDSSSASESVSVSVSDQVFSECDLCSLLPEDDSCEDVYGFSIERETGTPTGEVVWAHTTRLMPMMTGGMIKILKRTVATSSCASESSSVSGSESASASVSDDLISDRIYDVVDGVWPLLALPFPKFLCCEDPVTGESTVEMVQCNKAIVEGYECEGEYLGCPGSESVSGSGSG